MLECETGVKIQDNTVATLTLNRCLLSLTSPSASWLEMKCQEGCQRVTCELSIDPTFPLPDARDHMCDGCKHEGRIQDWFNAKTSSSGINKHPSGSSVCIILSIHDTVVHSWINNNHGTRTESCGNRELRWWNHVTWMTDLNPPAFAQRSKSSLSNSARLTVILAQKLTGSDTRRRRGRKRGAGPVNMTRRTRSWVETKPTAIPQTRLPTPHQDQHRSLTSWTLPGVPSLRKQPDLSESKTLFCWGKDSPRTTSRHFATQVNAAPEREVKRSSPDPVPPPGFNQWITDFDRICVEQSSF